MSGKWRHFDSTNSGLMNLFVWLLAEDGAERLWVGTWGAGLFVQNDDHFNFAPGVEQITVPMPALLSTPDDGLWVGTESGLLHYKGTNGVWIGQRPGLVRTDVRAIAQDEDGRNLVWNAGWRTGLF